MSIPVSNLINKQLKTREAMTDASNILLILMLIGVHIVLALAMKMYPILSTFHAILTGILGLLIVLFAKRTKWLIIVTGYITGSEVLWRMTSADVFWEYGKYVISALFVISIIRYRILYRLKISDIWPILYFLLLLLSVPLTINALGIGADARNEISFNLSGPLSLFICVLFLSKVKINSKILIELAWSIFTPIVGISTLILAEIIGTDSIIFTNDSNFAMSGGFGPNQVSAILGVGTIFLFFVLIYEIRWLPRLLALSLLIISIVQSALTFSRGGIYNLLLTLPLAIIIISRSPGYRSRLLFVVVLLGIILGYLVLPQLDNFTSGMLSQRFSDLNPTLRQNIGQVELDIWFSHPVLGVGPGIAKYQSFSSLGILVAAHTEYTRMLAEHGVVGLLAIIILICIAVRAFFKANGPLQKAYVLILVGWPMAEMSHAAMRLVAVSYLFGLAQMAWQESKIERMSR